MAAEVWEGYRTAWYALLAAMGVVTVATFLYPEEIYGPGSAFATASTGFPPLDSAIRSIPDVLDCVRVAFLGYVLGRIAVEAITRGLSGTPKGVTAARLACSVIKYAVAIVIVCHILLAAGVDVIALIAGAGILTLVIGLGAEPLIKDVIAGLFTVFEDEYHVGDIVVVDGWRGTVKEIGIRCTKIEDYGGNVLIVGNSEIGEMENLTKDLSMVVTVVSLGFEGSVEGLERMFRENIHLVRDAIPQIVDGPYYRGVSGYSDYYVELTFHTYCEERDYYVVERALQREIQMLYNDTEVYDPYYTYTFHGLGDDIPSYRRWRERLAEQDD